MLIKIILYINKQRKRLHRTECNMHNPRSSSFMTDLAEIRRIGSCIGETFRPEKVILYGSYALQKAHPDSDVDLLVIMPLAGKGVYQAARIRSQLKTNFPVDVIVHSQQEVQSRLQDGDPFIREIMTHGKVLYEAKND